ncbi:nucleotidyltransferase domain-containing protein [Infirmifilum lucidum]|uniref:Nucleotidyltransferase domain-containing protein n=1 Tax=Infirmifilum lucidum TaxID=2776706 RepID=A0A7L9FHZ8_9CREN|nr:nucleotidyltransferase domain-containing protein [Infirmifilum lucidum]QOJ79281.1 nucleotidyltransferase domain-containing protein [Infirmifilum lucidum]
MEFEERYTYYRGRREEVLGGLRRILGTEPKVLLATVFGSFAEGEVYRDVDVAVYAVDADLHYYLTLGARLEMELGVPVDLVPLDEAPPTLTIRALKGIVVVEKAPGLYEALLSRALDELRLIEAVER